MLLSIFLIFSALSLTFTPSSQPGNYARLSQPPAQDGSKPKEQDKSNKHIVCPIYGIGFGSEGGGDRHTRQFHRSAQNLTCFGCKSTYRSAPGLMHHIENGECVEIRQDRPLVEQQKKLMRKEALDDFIAPAVPSLVGMDEDDDGGVQLPMTRSDLNREAMANQPDSITANANGPVDHHWPTLR